MSKSQAKGKPCKKCGADDWYIAKPYQCAPCARRGVRESSRAKPVALRLWLGARARARRRGIAFDISVAHIEAVMGERCPVTGHEWGTGPWAPSLDRLRPALGYAWDNIAVISTRANKVKNDADSELILQLYRWLKRKGL